MRKFMYGVLALMVVSCTNSAVFSGGGRTSAAESAPLVLQAVAGVARFIFLPRLLRRR